MQMSLRPSARCAWSAAQTQAISREATKLEQLAATSPGLCSHHDLDYVVDGDRFSDDVLTKRLRKIS